MLYVVDKRDETFRKPSCAEKGGCCFKCVSGLCPYGYDPITDCYPYMTPQQKRMFRELFILRSEFLQYTENHSKSLPLFHAQLQEL